MTDIELLKKYIPESKWDEAINKLNEGYPIQYIIGNVQFIDSTIEVNENVLIPRFETEYLVTKTINYLKKLNINNPKVLEIGTGSGCISIALKKAIDCNITSIDISAKAIELAKKNAIQNNVNIDFFVFDIHNFNDTSKYDLIISNPPYVKYDKDIKERLKYEPENAIFAKDNGLYFYDVILKKVSNNLKEYFLIAFEIDDGEGQAIKDIASKYLNNINIYIEKDYNNLERYLFITSKDLYHDEENF